MKGFSSLDLKLRNGWTSISTKIGGAPDDLVPDVLLKLLIDRDEPVCDIMSKLFAQFSFSSHTLILKVYPLTQAS